MEYLTKYRFWIFVACALLSVNLSAKDYYLAVKGGVSLGSYEAGYNWNFIDDIRIDGSKELKVVSGASAGAINAIASVIQMCGSEQTTMMDNLFFQIWNMDIESLLPKKEKESEKTVSNYYEDEGGFEFTGSAAERREEPSSGGAGLRASTDSPYYKEKGGVFTRKAFDDVINKLKTEVARDDFKEPCDISFTLSVTKFNPSLVDLHDGLAPMKVSRHVIPLQASVINGRLTFANEYTNKKDDRWYQKIYLPTASDDSVPFHHIIKSALSSSAYPVAFSPIELSYCVNEEACNRGVYKSALFSDGGLFDNAPVGAATERLLFKGEAGFDSQKDLNVSVHYLDPAMTRSVDAQASQEDKEANKDVALGAYMGYFLSAMDVGMSQELYRARQMLKIKDIKIHSSTRRYPLASNFHANFSGFYSQDFRAHDYLVGVYDSVFDQAMLSGDGEGDSRRALAQRVKKEIERITPATCCNGSKDIGLATEFLWFLYEDEFSIDEFEMNYFKNPHVLLSLSLRSGWDASHGYQHEIVEVEGFNEFVDNLTEMVGDDLADDLYHASTVELINDRTDWMGGVANRAYDNLIEMQSEANNDEVIDRAINEILQVSQAIPRCQDSCRVA